MSNSGVWEWDLERFPNPQGMIQTPEGPALPPQLVDVALHPGGRGQL